MDLDIKNFLQDISPVPNIFYRDWLVIPKFYLILHGLKNEVRYKTIIFVFDYSDDDAVGVFVQFIVKCWHAGGKGGQLRQETTEKEWQGG